MTKQADDIRLLPNDLQSLQFTLPFRTDEGAKQDFGRAVIVGGSASFVGAPCFAAESAAEVLALAGEAAMRSGAGTTALALPDILLPALYPHLRYSAAFALPSSGGNGKASLQRRNRRNSNHMSGEGRQRQDPRAGFIGWQRQHHNPLPGYRL